MNKEYLKKSGQELQDYLAFRRRGSTVRAKKGKGSYSRKIKNKKEWQKKCLTNDQKCVIIQIQRNGRRK